MSFVPPADLKRYRRKRNTPYKSSSQLNTPTTTIILTPLRLLLVTYTMSSIAPTTPLGIVTTPFIASTTPLLATRTILSITYTTPSTNLTIPLVAPSLLPVIVV